MRHSHDRNCATHSQPEATVIAIATRCKWRWLPLFNSLLVVLILSVATRLHRPIHAARHLTRCTVFDVTLLLLLAWHLHNINGIGPCYATKLLSTVSQSRRYCRRCPRRPHHSTSCFAFHHASNVCSLPIRDIMACYIAIAQHVP